MYNMLTNIYILIIVAVTLSFELLITKLLDVSSALPWGITISIYLLFVLSQILVKANEESEKNRVKGLLNEIMDTINGIPVINKNEKLIIKWDIVFKKLVDHKEFGIYDKIIKNKTHHIDAYVNKYPSLLKDDSIDLREIRYNIDLNSTIKNKRKKDEKIDTELVKDEENKRRLFIREIREDTAVFSNYNSSIYVDVMLKNEYVPENAVEKDIDHDSNYDGFSVWMAYQNEKINVVPRVMMHKKQINKSKWFVDNINALLDCATSIVNGDLNNILYVDNYKLINYLVDIPEVSESSSILKFKQLKNEVLVFMGTDKNNKATTAYCEFKTGYNRFEVILKNIEVKEDGKIQSLDVDKTVAIGSSFQPLVTMLEKMPELIRNIELVINNQDISSIVIS
ncbi:MAG: hypothetical protein A2Y23_09870 [Clostridiales bacterium GWB2_37_7]|nr:MAG: hypothetical protein A2Y23_09870 [Clostridiales bacterium GWB2_37_7]